MTEREQKLDPSNQPTSIRSHSLRSLAIWSLANWILALIMGIAIRFGWLPAIDILDLISGTQTTPSCASSLAATTNLPDPTNPSRTPSAKAPAPGHSRTQHPKHLVHEPAAKISFQPTSLEFFRIEQSGLLSQRPRHVSVFLFPHRPDAGSIFPAKDGPVTLGIFSFLPA